MKSSDIELEPSDDGYIVFFRKETTCSDRLEFYNIPLRDLAHPCGWDEWTKHLEQKTWYDFSIEDKMASIVKTWRAKNEAIHRN